MKAIKITINKLPKKDKPIIFVPVSDLHIGSISHDKKKWEKVKRFIIQNDNCYWFGLGDYGDFIPHRDKRYDPAGIDHEIKNHSTGSILSGTINKIVSELKPIKDKCLFLLSGNHDDKYRKTVGIDIVEIITEKLGISQKWSAYEVMAKILFKKHYSLTIYASHGWGGGMLKGSKINRAQHVARSFLADIIVSGHSHDMVVAPDLYIRPSFSGESLVEGIRWLIRVSGFKKSRSEVSEYEEFSGMPPNVTGTVAIVTTIENGKIHPTINFIV